jgi:hypothetical protein
MCVDMWTLSKTRHLVLPAPVDAYLTLALKRFRAHMDGEQVVVQLAGNDGDRNAVDLAQLAGGVAAGDSE